MSFTEAVSSVLGKYATFSGRARRSEYWWWVLFLLLVGFVAGLIDAMVIAPMLGFSSSDSLAGQPLSLIITLALLIPGLAVSVRRLHDIDKSGWWLLISLIPLIGLLLLIYFAVQPGTEGPNRFGPPVS